MSIGLEILAEVGEGRRHASDVIARAFRRNPALPLELRAQLAEMVYEILRSIRRLDHGLDGAARPAIPAAARERARWIASLLRAGALTPGQARKEMKGVDWERFVEIDRSLGGIADPVLRLALLESLPDWLADRLIRELGEEARSFARAVNEPPPQTIRANRVRTDRGALAHRLGAVGIATEPTPLAPDGLLLETRAPIFRLPEFQDGLFEVQDEGSQLVSELVAPPPGGWILDACAGTGGKTLHLASLLRGKGRIAAIGVGAPGAKQLEELRRRAERAGVHNVTCVPVAEAPPLESLEEWPAPLVRWIGRADRVVVDAPCSGLGVLRRNPEARWRLEEEDVTRLAALQLSILERFARFVKPGGRLVYATCSVLREENDEVVAAFLDRRPEFAPMSAKEILGTERALAVGDGQVLRVLPHRHGTDGFFAAVLRRRPD